MEHKYEATPVLQKRRKLPHKGTAKEICYVFITLLVYILVGVSRSYAAFLFHQLDQPDSKIRIEDGHKSWIASSLGILSPLGCLVSGSIMDFFGRKFFIQMMFIPFIISWLMVAFADSYSMLFIGMMIQGLGGGMSFCISTYICEISTMEHRGALLGTLEVAYNIGVLLSNLMMYFLKWDTVASIYAAFSIFSLSLTIILPESPIWLYLQGKKEKSIKILCSLRCQTVSELRSEIQDMETSYSSEINISITNTVKNCLRAWRQLSIAVGLITLLQHTGYSIMVAYTITIVDKLQIPYNSSKITIVYSVVGFIGAFVTPYVMHNVGRKSLLSVSALGMALSMMVIGSYEQLYHDVNEKPNAWLVPGALFVYVLLCNVGVLPIGFIVGGELFPYEVAGIMNGIYGIFAYAYWSLTLKVYPEFLFHFGIKIIVWAFAVSCFIVSLYGVFILPETKGKTVNEVQEQYFKKKKRRFIEEDA
ncbi:facilitated trehalose transporter Tret1-like [Planococcus citri]|uniref:facilitated trehalose transporter Tret1-like n=1 Tax=Planococcus citri TaxID=170843 RepID=UPI0031F95E74